jgi:Kef-type K+ transport system membrane component KefB/nucleotide-binding universal stress UspA family protein
MFAVQTPPVVLKGLSHGTLFLLLIELGLLLGVARLLGEGMRKLRQPAVIGELLAGLVLGPSILGAVAPRLEAALFPPVQAQADLLSSISSLGVLMLLVVTGLEVDLDLIVRKASTAIGVSLGGIVVPMLCGFGLGWCLPDDFLVNPSQRVVFSLFVAVAMSISAIPVIAKVLQDMELMRRDIGQVILAAAMTDDTIGWVLLSVVAALAGEGTVSVQSVLASLASALLLVVLGLRFGPRLMNSFLTWVDEHFTGPGPQLSAILVVTLLMGGFTHWLGLESVLGAFLVGVVTARASRLQHEVTHTLELITASLLSPIFFATAGLKVNVLGLCNPRVLLVTLIAIAVACFGKYAGCYLGGKFGGLTHWERLAAGSGMNARGAIGFIVAALGLSLGVLTQQTYSIIVTMAIVTSLMAPPTLRWALGGVVMGPAETLRLRHEAREQTGFIRSVRRVMVPSKGGRNIQFAAWLLRHVSKLRPVEVTGVFVDVPDQPVEENEALGPVQEGLERAPRVRVVTGKSVVEAILSEARRGYHLLVLGASDTQAEGDAGASLSPMMDQVVQGAPCATMIVKARADAQDEIRTILAPTVGTHYSNHAVEMAAVLSVSLGAPLTIVHVVPRVSDVLIVGQRSQAMHRQFGEQIVDAQADLARHFGAQTTTLVLEGNDPEKLILELVAEQGFDLIMMGTNLHPIMKRTFLGHKVEGILRQASCAVAVLSSV